MLSAILIYADIAFELLKSMFLIPVQQAVAIQQRVVRRRPNKRRVPAETEEASENHFRLTQEEITLLTEQYDEWRLVFHNLERTHMHVSERQIKAFNCLQ